MLLSRAFQQPEPVFQVVVVCPAKPPPASAVDNTEPFFQPQTDQPTTNQQEPTKQPATLPQQPAHRPKSGKQPTTASTHHPPTNQLATHHRQPFHRPKTDNRPSATFTHQQPTDQLATLHQQPSHRPETDNSGFDLSTLPVLRGSRSILFISFKKGHTSDIRPATHSSWLKQTVLLCYKQADQQALDLVQVKTHDIRAFAASKAFYGGVSVDQIMQACHWKAHNTFTNFYLKDLTWSDKNNNMYLGPVVAAQQVLDPSPQHPYLREEKRGGGGGGGGGHCHTVIHSLNFGFYCINTSFLVDRCICPAPCQSHQTLEKKRPELGSGRDS